MATQGTATTFGSDFSAVDDFDGNWTFYDNSFLTPNVESIALAQALARRYTTPRGGLFYDPMYGYDLRSLVGSSASLAAVQTAAAAEARKDERVNDCSVVITPTGNFNGETWKVQINAVTSFSQVFQLTLNVSAVTVSLLTVGP